MLFERQRRENLSTDGELTRVISRDYVSYSNVFTYNVRTYSSNCACYFGRQRRENLSTNEQLTIIFVITSSDTTFFMLRSLIVHLFERKRRENLSTNEQLTAIIFVITSSNTTFFNRALI